LNVTVSGRDLAARQAVLKALVNAHERFSSRETEHRAAGNHVLAEGAHRYAVWCLRAYRSELDDRKPKNLG
jgi:hypothetical protein